ncbi:class II aldolase/adducin family protein [Acetivibrio cellulolyticus]|uniref:class II aldolase/adducin family protein n=1 Tax=Acetivibrio cellulolyticus TaxID=35830 RepID=UPI0001E2BDB9|nr:class II aldolase/adducin family protein [Acetivibrio cellulolyticus]
MEDLIRKNIVKVSKLMYDKELVNPYEGNVSILHEEQVYITPAGICKGYLTEDMIVVTDLNGNVLEGMYKPSSEIKLHLASYKLRSDIRSVVHAHPPFSTAYAVANKPIETKAYTEMIALFDKIPVAKYGTPSTDQITDGIKDYIDNYDIILLANHGIISVGTDIFNAFFKLEAAESMAKTLLLTKMLGGEKELPDVELEKLYEMNKKHSAIKL